MGSMKKAYRKRKKKNTSKVLPAVLLTTMLSTQATITTFAAENTDNSAIEPKEAAYGYFVDTYKNNESINMTPESNPSIGVLSKFLELWTPGTSWDNGTVLNSEVHNHNIDTVISITNNRTEEEAKEAYLNDRRNQNYSAIAGLGAYADNFKASANAGTTIPDEIPADATTVKYEDEGNENGNWADDDSSLGNMVKLVNAIRGTGASTSSAKAYYNYKRPFRWSEQVSLVPTLVPAKKDDPSSDGGFPSGHTNAAYLASYGLAYAVPERFEEIMTSASDIGNSRIVAGMHSPLDVIGGRVMSTAVAAAALNDPSNSSVKEAAYTEAHEVLLTQEGTSEDRYSDYETNKKKYTERLTYGFEQTGDTTKEMTVPKGAEVLLETRFPYLDDTQRRWVLYTTGLPSGYPVLDDTEGWGRLNLFAAAGGYEDFETDVEVTMDASKEGFHASDSWKNDIAGSGKLTKLGTGTLTLTGDNTYTGGTVIEQGTLVASSSTAFGDGEVINNGGTLNETISSSLTIGDSFTQTDNGTLELTIGKEDEELTIDGEATFDGVLKLNFVDGYVPTEDEDIITYESLTKDSAFSSVEITGLPETYEVVYDENAIRIVDSSEEEAEEETPNVPSEPVDPGKEEEDNTGDNESSNEENVTNEDNTNTENSSNNEDNSTEVNESTEDTLSENSNTNSSTNEETVENPQTGDHTNLFVYIGLLVVSALSAAFVFFKRKGKSVNH